jgi:glycosyltransferase involved in cell wall biosynthesis
MLSIIIPCYNCEKTLKEAVTSCFNQNIPVPFEIIMVDDCSHDTTWSIMQKLATTHPEIKIYKHSKNQGGGATRNSAVKYSSGDVIFCLDSDDLLGPHTLGRMYTFLISHKLDGVGIHISKKFNGTNIDDIARIDTFGYTNSIIPKNALLEKKGGAMCPLYSTFMHTKKAFMICGGYPTHHGFDTQGFAWRFLMSNLRAQTCADTTYLHRINFHKSYYIREYESGRSNYNWLNIFLEHLPSFPQNIQDLIFNFDIRSSSNLCDSIKDICSDLDNNNLNISKPTVIMHLTHIHSMHGDIEQARSYVNKIVHISHPYIAFQKKVLDLQTHHTFVEACTLAMPHLHLRSNTSIRGLYVRAQRKIVQCSKKYSYLYKTVLIIKGGICNIINIFKERNTYTSYYRQISDIISRKEIVLDIPHGGLGDWLAFSSLPRLLYETYGIHFYITHDSVQKLRNPDTYKICFEQNPYFRGIKETSNPFRFKIFNKDKKIITVITDMWGDDVIQTIEKQFNIPHIKGVPEIYYKPRHIPEFSNTILVDTNQISGLKNGWRYSNTKFTSEINKHMSDKDQIVYVNPANQNIFEYADQIYSSKYFISTLSGGAVLASALRYNLSVILPDNIIGGSVSNFTFKKSGATYIT